MNPQNFMIKGRATKIRRPVRACRLAKPTPTESRLSAVVWRVGLRKNNGLAAEAANPLISFLNFGGLGRHRMSSTCPFQPGILRGLEKVTASVTAGNFRPSHDSEPPTKNQSSDSLAAVWAKGKDWRRPLARSTLDQTSVLNEILVAIDRGAYPAGLRDRLNRRRPRRRASGHLLQRPPC